MGKIVAIIVIVALVYFLILPKFTRSKYDIKKTNEQKKGITDLVECTKCGTMVDLKDATISSSGYICNECIKRK